MTQIDNLVLIKETTSTVIIICNRNNYLIMLDFIKSKFIAGTELKKVQEQYKEFFTFLNRYGYRFISKDISILHEKNVGYDTDYICIELIFERSADFICISKMFLELTNTVLPIYPDLNANQFIGIRLLRINNEYHPYYKVNRMGFEILSSRYTTTHYRMFNTYRFVWPMHGDPYMGCSQEFLDNMHEKAMKECVNDLIRSIKFYNTENKGEGWYISYMKTNHPNAIPHL